MRETTERSVEVSSIEVSIAIPQAMNCVALTAQALSRVQRPPQRRRLLRLSPGWL
jgi:hypothetical protein